MSYIEFDDSLKVGNKIIDQEHETLISYINLLQKALENDASESMMETVLLGVVDYTKTHFFVEEELMRAYDYPDFESHKKAHEGFKKQALKYVKQLGKGETVSIETVLSFLKTWLTDHILKIDTQLAAFLKDKSMA